MKPPISHTFTKSEIKKAAHDFEQAIIKYFGEVWKIRIDAEYKGCTWECRDPKQIDQGLWHLCQRVKHKGAKRASGRIETKEVGTVLVFMIFYDPAGIIV